MRAKKKALKLLGVLNFFILTNPVSKTMAASYETVERNFDPSCFEQGQQTFEKGEALEKAKNLEKPSRELMLMRDPSVDSFWHRNKQLLEVAWKDWEEQNENDLPVLDETIFDPKLLEAVKNAWKNPAEKEKAVADLMEEVAPGVYAFQFLNVDQIHKLRTHLDKANESGIPLRPPYGITLNRKGYFLDERSVAHLAATGFQNFYKTLMDDFMRPIGRMLYPDYVQREDDSQTFGFAIAYREGPNEDKNIQQHSDASAVTLNLNINLPSEAGFQGSAVYFIDRETGEHKHVSFRPGVAVIHRGATMHASVPITKGERRNLVFWNYGRSGRFQRWPYPSRMTPEERWTKPQDDESCVSRRKDNWVPF